MKKKALRIIASLLLCSVGSILLKAEEKSGCYSINFSKVLPKKSDERNEIFTVNPYFMNI